MMKLKTIQASSIKTVFEVLKDIMNDVNLVFTKDGVSLCTLDNSHVTFVNMVLKADNFELYECRNRTLAGLNLLNTFKIFKTITNNDTLSMSISEKCELIDIKIENEQKHTNTKFSLKLLDINDEIYDQPSIDMKYHTVIQATVFQRMIRDMSVLADKVRIQRFGKKIVFKCDGDFVTQETEIECADEVDTDLEEVYSLKYINMFIKATSICSNIEIMQSEQGPIAFKYSIANLGDITFFLAPVSD
jgi:proliferating cell nuclear antigen